MTHSSEFPELGPHPEFANNDMNELLPATEETIGDIWTVAKMLAKNTYFSFTVDEKKYGVMSMSEGTIPTGVVASIEIRSIYDKGLDGEKILYNIIKQEKLSIHKLFLGPAPDYGSIDDPEAVAHFMRDMIELEQKREQARAMGLLDVSQKEADDLLNLLLPFIQ